jgi:hypothetical protein
MSMSDPFLPQPPTDEDVLDREEIEDVEDDEQPDVLVGPADDESAEEGDAGTYRTPQPGDRLTAEELATDLD